MNKYIGVELARTGRFDASTGPVTLTKEDFDNIAEAYTELKGKIDIPVKLGHDEQNILEEAGLPAAGWVENIRRVGEKLLADITGVPDAVAKLIESGGLRKRSIEAVRNVKLAGKRYKMALTGLALLGSELPAVDSLEDITALYASGKAFDTLGSDSEITARIICTSTGIMPKLSTARIEISEKVTMAIDIAKYKALLKLPDTATDEEVETAIEAMLEQRQQSEPPQQQPKEKAGEGEEKMTDTIEAALAPVRKELAEAQKQIVILTNDKARSEVTTAVDEAIKAKKFMPASRDSLIKLALADKDAFDEMVKSTSANSILTSERGTSATSELPSELEPTELELKIAAQIGMTKEKLIAQKAKDAGINYQPAATKS